MTPTGTTRRRHARQARRRGDRRRAFAPPCPSSIERHKLVPTLAIVLVGNSPASERYVKKKIEACARLQMRAEVKAFPTDIGADDLVSEVAQLEPVAGVPRRPGPAPAAAPHRGARRRDDQQVRRLRRHRAREGRRRRRQRGGRRSLSRAARAHAPHAGDRARGSPDDRATTGSRPRGDRLSSLDATTSRRSPSCTCSADGCATPPPSGAIAT